MPELRGVRQDPACASCRQRCRKCDRVRPTCGRCSEHLLACEYPPRFQFHQIHAPRRNDRRRRHASTTSPQSQPNPWPDVSLTSSNNISWGSGTLDSPPPSAGGGGQLETPPQDSDPTRIGPVLALATTQELLQYFDERLCDHLAISTPDISNPFRHLVLPLAGKHYGALQAILGLTICHARTSPDPPQGADLASMLEHRLAAIHELSSLLLKEQVCGLNSDEEEELLATALVLILHDICELGMSAHGAHLTGVAAYCGHFVTRADAVASPAKAFLLTALAWLDLSRGFSGAEKLAYADEVRQVILQNNDFSLEVFVGCPVRIFRRVGKVLSTGKRYLADAVARPEFEVVLNETESFLRAWSPDDEIYPSKDPNWRLIANAYRHASILRVMRFPDPFSEPCSKQGFQDSVHGILDACALIPRGSAFHKRLLFPLFMAGVETDSPHLQDYISLQLAAIISETGFRHESMLKLLSMTWEERKENAQGWLNVPWTEYTCSTLLERQHDYLFF